MLQDCATAAFHHHNWKMYQLYIRHYYYYHHDIIMIIIIVIKVVGLRFVFSAIIRFDLLNHTKDRDKSKTQNNPPNWLQLDRNRPRTGGGTASATLPGKFACSENSSRSLILHTCLNQKSFTQTAFRKKHGLVAGVSGITLGKGLTPERVASWKQSQ